MRVIDLTQYEAGPSATQLLAWLGADVIKVEPPGGDPARQLAGATPERDSAFFVLYNQSKRSVVLDLSKDGGRRQLDRLLEGADVLAENFAPGTLAPLGLAPERLGQAFPRLVVASIRGYRSGGPWSDYKSLDFVGQATGAGMSVTGEANRPPVRMGSTVADSGSGVHLALGILAALHRRFRTDRGGRVEVALQDAVLNLTRTALVPTYVTGEPNVRSGDRYVGSAPSGVFACRPGGPNDYVYILLSSRRHWEALLRAIERQDLLDDPRYARQSQRNAREDEVCEIVSAWTRPSRQDRGDGTPVGVRRGLRGGARYGRGAAEPSPVRIRHDRGAGSAGLGAPCATGLSHSAGRPAAAHHPGARTGRRYGGAARRGQ